MNTAEYLDYYLTTPDYIDAEGNVYDESDLRERYDDMLDEEGPVTIGGLEYSVSRVLQEVDPIAGAEIHQLDFLSEGADEETIRASVEAMVARVQAYVPGYRLKQAVQFERFGDNNRLKIPGQGSFTGV